MTTSALSEQHQRDYFNRVAKRPDWAQLERDLGTPAFQRESSAFIEFADIRPKSLILDFGCGRGLWSLAFARLGHTVVSVDLSERSIEPLAFAGPIARPGFVLPVVGTPMVLGSLATARFDAVICVDVLHHVEDIPGTVNWMVSLLRPGGVFASIEPNARFPFWRLMPWVIPGFDWAFEQGVVRCREEYLADTLQTAGGLDVRVAHWKLLPGNLTERFPFLKRIEDMALTLNYLRDRCFFLMLRGRTTYY
ncbi:MAG: class I SAM-dependent methyltransferase [Chloroflexi bacterium]|nr:class I SAM-dependent methyltransferase [Chloroflexota bacterium]